MKSMRWLVAGPGYPDGFAENIAVTLRAMGHEVLTEPGVPAASWWRRFGAIVTEFRERASAAYLRPGDRWLLQAARRWKPDVFLAPTQVVHDEVLETLPRMGVKARIAWWGDPPANLRRMGLASRRWDLLLLKDPDAVSKFRCIGLEAHLLHEAMNPVWHRPLAAQRNRQVVVAGNWYGYRQALVLELIAHGVEVGVYGSPLPRWANPRLRPLHTGRYITKEEKSVVFGEGLACLNSFSLAEANSLNCRAFEIAGAGGLQLLEYRPVAEECFDPGRELLAYRSLPELLEHVERATKAPEEMARIRQAAARRALAEHTYRHRIERIVSLLRL